MPNIKEKISKILPKNSFIRSVSVLVGGTATAQVISILASPVLTRLYTTEDFGLLAVYGSIIGIVGVIASLRYELAIPIAETDK
jgi:O-antigen/teichoic acid export membrane protein